MQRARLLALVVLAAAICVPAAPIGAQQGFADQVDEAIEKGVAFLLARQLPNGSWAEFEGHEDKAGMTPLVCYALLEAGVSAQNEQMLKALAYLDGQGTINMFYGMALRAVALQVANEQTNDKYFSTLEADVGSLARSATGRYHYGEMDGTSWDNSNGQYAVLGVWAGAENDRMDRIPKRYWQAVQQHWFTQQNGDGGWGYYDGPPHVQAPDGVYYYGNATQATMTVGGIATLYICEDNLPPSPAVVQCDNVTTDPHIARGLAWLDNNFRWTLDQPHMMLTEWYYYYLYGVERAALASGRKHFGGLDWYKEGADRLIARQAGDGSWIGTDGLAGGVANTGRPGAVQANTAFALLFLIRGRQPLIFNKLQFNGDWNNRSRDLASASRWLSKVYEHSVNWQIVDMGMSLDEWRDAPIMYISAKGAVNFAPHEIAKLREYVYQGGTILSVAEAGGQGFNQSMRNFYAQVFPRYSLEACDPDHRLYDYPNDLDPAKVKIFEVSNGVRPLAIHVENDLSLAWQKRDMVRDRWAFQALANITLYFVENLIDLPQRRVNLWPAGQSAAFAGSVGGAMCDIIYLEIGGEISPIEASAAGQQVQSAEGVITIPQPDAPGRTIVYCEPTAQYISVENHRLGQTLPAPNGQAFLAKAPEVEPVAPALVLPSPSGRADITVIRLQNANDAANCNPEPLAWQRFTTLLNDRTGTGVAVVGPVDITDLNNQAAAHGAKLAVLTGTKALTLSTAEQQAIKDFITGGGTLFIDTAGGLKATGGFGSTDEFADSVKKLLRDMYDRSGRLADIPPRAAMFQLPGNEIKSVAYRVRTAERLGTNEPKLQAMHIDEEPVIIFSPWDVTTGLVGFNSGAFEGYAPESAYAIMRNIVLSRGR